MCSNPCVVTLLQVPDELVMHLMRRSGDDVSDKEL
jgi:hypothetical protein